MNRILPRGEFLPVPLLSCISFGPPIWLEAGRAEGRFLRRAREAVRRLKELVITPGDDWHGSEDSQVGGRGVGCCWRRPRR